MLISSLEMLMSGLMPVDETLNAMLNIARNSTARISTPYQLSVGYQSCKKSGQQIVDQNSVDPILLVREAIRDVEAG
ncbi:MAG: hypothetical protein IPL27_22925 [Lewinellaceae bacterium]|nr:hypothetical protein [Lewinellaceae bacterium]